MNEMVVHPTTKQSIERFVASGFHAGLITGPAGSGKGTIVRQLSAELLGLHGAALDDYPYIRIIRPLEGKSIPIESIRELQRFISLKIPGSEVHKISRIIIIEDAHLLTTEAQNALLKTLEEPPESTLLVLTATSIDALLPTIQSRVQTIHVITPAADDVRAYFSTKYEAAAVDRAILISGGLPGLTHALLSGSEDHPLHQATEQARALLQASAYERVAMVDSLSKQKQLCMDILFILGQMSRMALIRSQTANLKASERWLSILRASYDASEQLRQNAQAKLVLTDLMLAM